MGGTRLGDPIRFERCDKGGVADERQALVEWESCGHDLHLTSVHWGDALDSHLGERQVLLDYGSGLGGDPTPRLFLCGGSASEEAGPWACRQVVTARIQLGTALAVPRSKGEAEVEATAEDDVEAEGF